MCNHLAWNLHLIPISRHGPKPLEPCRIINFEMISTGSSRKLRPSSWKMSSKRMGCSTSAQYRELTSEPALPYSVRTWRLSLSLGPPSRIWTDGKSALLKNNVSVLLLVTFCTTKLQISQYDKTIRCMVSRSSYLLSVRWIFLTMFTIYVASIS